MKKKLLFLIPIVFLIAFLIMVFNNKTIKVEDFKTKKLTSYVDVLEDEKSIENTDSVKFDAYFLVDKDNDGYADKIRGNSMLVGSSNNLRIILSVSNEAKLENAKIEFINSNVKVGVSRKINNQTFNGSDINEMKFNNPVISGTNLDFNVQLNSSLTNDFKSYNQTNKVVLTGTVVENGVITEIRKEINYIADWYILSPRASIYNKYNIYSTNKDGNIEITYDFNTRSYSEKLVKSANIEAYVPKLDDVDPIKVRVEGTNITYNYDSSTYKLTANRHAVLNDTMIINSAYDYYDSNDNYVSNNFRVVIEYPYTYSEDVQIPYLNVNAWYEIYNNPDPDYENVLTSNIDSKVLVKAVKVKDEVTYEVHEDMYPAELSLWTNTLINGKYSATLGKYLSKTDVLNLYDGIDGAETDTYQINWNVNARVQCKDRRGNSSNNCVPININADSLIISDDNYDTFNSDVSTKDMVKYKTINVHPSYVFGNNGYIKMYDADTNELITIFTKDNWNTTYEFETNVRRIYLETSGIENLLPSLNYTYNLLNVDITKEIDNNEIVNNFTNEQFNNFQYIQTKTKTRGLGEFIARYIWTDYSSSIDYMPFTSATINLKLNKNSFETGNEENVIATIEIGNTDEITKGFKNGEFLLTFPKEFINIDINNITSDNDDVTIVGYELEEENDKSLLRIITSNSEPTRFKINIDMNVITDPRTLSSSSSIGLFGINGLLKPLTEYTRDLYDVDKDNDKEERVSWNSKEISFVVTSDVITTNVINTYDENNVQTSRVSPQLADFNPLKDQNKTEVEIGLTNNSSESLTNIVVIGKLAYIGNTYQIGNGNLGSQFNATMQNEGITVSNVISDKVRIYYSTKDNPTRDINDVSNNWKSKEDVANFDDIKSFIIFVDNYTLGRDSLKFTYKVNLPQDISYLNNVTYFTHGIYYDANTEDGLVDRELSGSKSGIRMAMKYNLDLTDYKLATSKPIKDSTYLLNDSNGNTRILKTNVNGNYIAKGLYVGQEYTLTQYDVKFPYIKDEKTYTFKVINDSNGELKLSGNETGDYKSISLNSNILKVDLNNDVRYELVINNTDLETDEPILMSKFKLTGKGYEEGKIVKTNTNGELIIKGLYLNEIYNLEQVSSSNYLLIPEPIQLYLTRDKDGNVVLTKSKMITEYGDLTMISSNQIEYTLNADGSSKYKPKNYGRSTSGYVEIDLTNYSPGPYKINFISDKGEYRGYNYGCVIDAESITTPSSTACYNINGEYSAYNQSGTFTSAAKYNSETNSYDSVEILGGKKYYIYIYMNSEYAYFTLYPIERVDGGIERPIIYEKVNVVSDQNSNIIQTLEDTNTIDAPIYTLDIKSKKIPTYNLEVTKVSADTKEPLKDAQYRITGFGLPISGAYIKTDENGKASIELNKSLTVKSNDDYKIFINGYDYSIADSYYSIQEVVPPLGYQIDNKKINFKIVDTYNVGCTKIYNTNNKNCEINDNSEHSNSIAFEDLNIQFVEYEFDETTNTLKVVMYDYPLINITKKDSETGELLPNTLFAIYSVSHDSNGKEVLEPAKDTKGNILGIQLKINNKYYNVMATDSNGKLVLALPSGEYKALEVQVTDDKYQIVEEGQYFSVGPLVGYDDSKLQYFGSMYVEGSRYNWYNNTQYGEGGQYTDIIPTSDGGWLVAAENITYNSQSYSYSYNITIKKFDRNLNLEWERDANSNIEKNVTKYVYFDQPGKVVYGPSSGQYVTSGYERTHLSETNDGYYVSPHYMGVIKFDKNGNREWQNVTSIGETVYYTALCDIDDANSGNSYITRGNEYIYKNVEYDPNNPYIQKDESTYYCSTSAVYDATYETVGGILKWEVYPNNEMRPEPKYDDNQYGPSVVETIYKYDDDGNTIGTEKQYVTQTPYLGQYNNTLRFPFSWYSGGSSTINMAAATNVTSIAATKDGGVTLLTQNYSTGIYSSEFLLSDGTYKSMSGRGYQYKRKNGECDSLDGLYERNECNLSFQYGSAIGRLLHYTSDGKFVSVDDLSKIYYYAIVEYNRVHGTDYNTHTWSDTRQKSTIHTFDNGDLLFVDEDLGLFRLRYDYDKLKYNLVYFLPKEQIPGFSRYSSSMPEIQTYKNVLVIKESRQDFNGKIVYIIDESGNITEDVSIFSDEDSFNFNPRETYRNLNGFYKLDNGNYIVYAQINTIENLGNYGIQDNTITLAVNGQNIYKTLNIESGKLYVIIYELNTDSQILWYKLYDITNNTGNIDNAPYSEYWTYTPVRYNKESDELLFVVQEGHDFPMTNVENPDETYTAAGNLLVFKFNDDPKPEVPEAYSIEVLNERKNFNINIESGENGKAYVLNGDNTVYTLNNETKDVENIKYGDNSIYTIKAKGNTDYVVDKVLLNGMEHPFIVLDDGSIILDNINDVTENKNIKITYKPGNAMVIVHHYIKDTETKIASDEIISGLATTPYETEPTLNELYSLVKDGNGEYILPSNYKGILKTTPTIVTYYYEENDVNLKVNYYKKNTTIELAPSKVERKLLGSSYKTSPINIEFYELVNVIGNEEGTLTKENTEVTYMYQETTDATVTTKYINKATEEEISDRVIQTVKRYDTYETEAKEIKGYKLIDKTKNYKGKAENEEIEVIYYYEKIVNTKIIPLIPKEIKEPIKFIINSKINLDVENQNKLEVIDEEIEKEKKLKETNSNLVIIVFLGLIALIGFIIGKLHNENNIKE